MRGARDIELAVIPVDNKWGVPNKRVAWVSSRYMFGAVIKVEPPKLVFVDPYYYQLLVVVIFVPWQWRFEVIRRDLVLIEIRGDYLVCMLASEH